MINNNPEIKTPLQRRQPKMFYGSGDIMLQKRVDPESLIRGMPFDVRNAIMPFYNQIRPNMTVWWYNSPTNSGYAIVNKDEIVATYVMWEKPQ
jgi:hypothetical protein